ncbi:cell surface glycoprotein 1-like [Argopecten irradians]|uniref:cell surface glycoprotein 1-like n=1 Tax=Argopecten irradians TaxID=31199 RepID=UPI0037215A83
MENPTVRDSDSDSATNTSEKCDSNPSPVGALSTAEKQIAVHSSDETFECSAMSTPSKNKDRENASPISLENPIVRDPVCDSDTNSCESTPSPEDTGDTAVVDITVCSSGETLKETSLSKTFEEKKEINGKKDYPMIKDKDDPQDDLSIKAEVGGTSSKSPDDKDDPPSPISLENPIVRDPVCDSDANSCESTPSPDDTGYTALIQIAVCSSGETLKGSAMSTSSEEEINGNNDRSVTKDKDGSPDDLSITAEVGGTSSKSPDDKDDPPSPVSLENPIGKDSNSDSDTNSCESKPSPEDTGNTAAVEIAVCSSGETLKETSLSETFEEKREINGKKDYSMIKDKDHPQDDLSITAEVGGTSSKSPDDKDDPPSPISLENPIVRDPVCDFDTNSCESKPSPDDTGNTTVVQIAECSSGETHKGFAMSTSSDEEINEKNDRSVTKGKHTSTRLCEDKDGQKENLSITADIGGTSSKSSTQRDDPRKPATTTLSLLFTICELRIGQI